MESVWTEALRELGAVLGTILIGAITASIPILARKLAQFLHAQWETAQATLTVHQLDMMRLIFQGAVAAVEQMAMAGQIEANAKVKLAQAIDLVDQAFARYGIPFDELEVRAGLEAALYESINQFKDILDDAA